MSESRTEEIINASETYGGYNKRGSYGVAWQEGVLWADKNPSKELIEDILTICNHIKDEEKSEFAPLTDCPYGYMVDELVDKIYKRIKEKDKNIEQAINYPYLKEGVSLPIRMKTKIENAIKDFISICNTYFKLGAANFAQENFYKIVENFWDDNKSDSENLDTIKSMFEMNSKLNEMNGSLESAKTISAFQEGWLNKIE